MLVKPGKGLIDPCPFWDDDGRAYIIHGYAKSRIGFKSWLGIFPLSPDGRTALGDDHLLYDGTKKHPTIEGPKVHKRGGWYYIFAPAGGVATGWQVCLRSRSISGPYETQVVLKQGSSETNGPHQGAWVETPEGEHWFLHFQSRGLYGRVTHLQPMTWQADGWPYIGIPDETPVPPDAIAVGEECAQAAPIANAADCGIAVETYRKPKAPECEPSGEIGDDDFSGALGLQWQFMGNWQPDFYEVGGGKLRLYARKLPDGGDRLWQCPQTLTQKIACPAFFATTTLDAAHLQAGEQAGVGFVGGQYAYAAVRRMESGVSLVFVTSEGKEHTESATETVPIQDAPVTFRVTLLPTSSSTAVASFEYAQDGEFHPIGQPFEPARHTWVGGAAGAVLYADEWRRRPRRLGGVRCSARGSHRNIVILFPNSPAPSACAFFDSGVHSFHFSVALLRCVSFVLTRIQKFAAHLGAFSFGNSIKTDFRSAKTGFWSEIGRKPRKKSARRRF